MKADHALKTLLEGNQRFVAGSLEHPHQTRERRGELVAGQQPIAAILTCSDSRTPPEIIFDQGLGDIFIIRTAGNIADDVSIGSMEMAVAEFAVPLIMVLGHQNCGAIKFAIEQDHFPGHIGSIMERIKPALASARNMDGNYQDNVARKNAQITVEQLLNTQPILKEKAINGELKIVSAYYWMEDGRVEIL